MTMGFSCVPNDNEPLFANLYDEEEVLVGEGGDGGARGVRRASDAALVNVGKAFRGGLDENDELVDLPGL